MRSPWFPVLLLAASAVACSSGEYAPLRADGGRSAGYTAPVMRNTQLPFRYPPDLYARKVQANVSLRLFIDSLGRVRPESTMVAESSGYPSLDSAAVTGARELNFTPAYRDGAPTGVSVIFPILFRHPGAPPMPGDTIFSIARRSP